MVIFYQENPFENAICKMPFVEVSVYQEINSSPPRATYMLLNWVIIDVENGLSVVWCQAII